MKKAITAMYLSIVLTAITQAQIKPLKSVKTVIQKAGATQDSIIMKFQRYQDTEKVRIVAYVEDHSMQWLNGWVIKSMGKFSETDTRELDKELFYDEKWNRMKDQDILSVNLYKWQ